MKPRNLFLSFFAAAVLFTTQAASATVLRYADPGPNRGVRADAVEFFASEIDRLSDGEIKIELHWGGSLFKFRELYNGVSSGAADMAAVWSSYAPQALKPMAIGDIPLQFSDPWVGMRAMYDLMQTEPQMRQALSDKSVVYLTNFTTGPVQFECASGNKVSKIEDLAGKSMRATGTYNNVLHDLGVNLVPMSYSEVYQGLDTGLLDCNGSYFYTMRAYKTYEIAESVTIANWGQVLGSGIVINRFAWDALDRTEQNILTQAGKNMVDYFGQKMVEEQAAVLSGLEDGSLGNGVQVAHLAAGEREKLISASEKYRTKWIEDVNKIGMNGEAIWESYIDLLEHYQMKVDSEGYPWQE